MINFQNLHDSITHYENNGSYTRIESPWTVTKAISDITRPPDKIDYEIIHNKKVLVASGEQSFLYLYLKGFLPLGRYQTITPCFRDEVFDNIHSKYFIKNELISTKYVHKITLRVIVLDAFTFFKTKLNEKYLEIVPLNEEETAYDITYQGIELGSYGIRECKFLKWIYGTGCAEPRLSYCQNL